MKPMQSILRQVNRPKDKLNILTCPTHEPFETMLCKTGHNFYAFRCEGVRDWNFGCRELPPNYTLLAPNTIPPDLDFDLVLFNNIVGQAQVLMRIAKDYQIPSVRYEHTICYPEWPRQVVEEYRKIRGQENIFISSHSRNAWLFTPEESTVVNHAIDLDTFKPDPKAKKNGKILSVCNDWINRDRPCGFNLWRQLTEGLPVLPLGNTPGLSVPAKSIDDLVRHYQESDIFLNTSILSPIPCALLEAMACGCAIVSTATCAIPEYLVNGYNAYISNDPTILRKYLEDLMSNPERRKKFGQNARATVEKKCKITDYVKRLNEIFYRVANMNVSAT